MTSVNIKAICQQAKIAALQLAQLSETDKNQLLLAMADQLEADTALILAGNAKDMAAGREKQLAEAMLDRLLLTDERIKTLANAVRYIAALPDPVGQIRQMAPRPNGIQVGKMRIPLGVIAMIYEARPNVTADAGALCLKSGNAVILRGGREALNSSLAIAASLHKAMEKQGVNPAAISVIPDPDRALLLELLQQKDSVDLVIPRGGEGLIHFVSDNSKIPVIQHYKGICHLYVDKAADLDKAMALLLNGKTQRPGVCNSLETLLVHQAIAPEFLALVSAAFEDKQVEVFACDLSLPYFTGATKADGDQFDT
ncbi:MAG: glutamate-5-semialdehyde dehydrogenase, partial [Pararheinheimera sp.]|nr:glutamate-5-semialdehyde dehydrogenase [Rheinheimera sp.]